MPLLLAMNSLRHWLGDDSLFCAFLLGDAGPLNTDGRRTRPLLGEGDAAAGALESP